MRKKSIIACMFILLALACTAIPGIRDYADQQNCVCSMLTTEEEIFTIDDRLYRVIEQNTMKSGVFMVVRTTCDHDKQLHLTVYPDEGSFMGYILDN